MHNLINSIIFATMTAKKIIDETTMLGTMNNHGICEEGVFQGDGYGLLWNSAKVNVSQWNKLDSPYRTSGYWLTVVESGMSGFSYNLKEHYLPAGSVFVMRPGVIVNQLNDIDDYDQRVLNLDEDFGSLVNLQEDYEILRLESKVLDIVEKYFNLVRRLCETHTDTKETVYGLASSLFSLVLSNKQTIEIQRSSVSRKQEVYQEFMSLLNSNGLREHRIGWYADRLAMTPNYLNSLIKEISGMTISDWISRLLVMEAKAILTHSDMSVREIADYLNFPNDAYFCRYFKKHTGYRPLEYRKR